METRTEFSELLTQVRLGDEAAARALVDRYGSLVLLLVRRQLGGHLRRRFESQDFTQNVWATFFAHRERIEDIETPESLAGFLAVLVRTKIGGEARKHLGAQKRSLQREEPFDEVQHNSNGMKTLHPTPSKIYIAKESFEDLCSQTNEQGRRILELKRAGLTIDEIAAELAINEKTVRRLLKRLEVSN